MSKKAVLVVIIGVVFGSTSGLAVKLGLAAGASASLLAFYRLTLVTLLLSPLLFKHNVRAEIRALSRMDALLMALAGAMLALHFFSWMTGLKYTSTAAATSLLSLEPLMVVALSYLFLKEKTPLRALVWAAPTILGALIISGAGMTGAIWSGLCALGYSVYLVCMRRLRAKLGAGAAMLLSNAVCSVFLLIVTVVSGELGFSPQALAAGLFMAVVCSLGGHMLFSWALKHLPAPTVSTLLLLDPLPAALWPFLFIGETPSGAVMLGGAIIIVSALMFTLMQARYHNTRDAEAARVLIEPPDSRRSLELRFVVIDILEGRKRVYVRNRERESWELPGGHIEPGETPEAAAARELYEETGIADAKLTALADYCVCWKSGERSWGRYFRGTGGQRGALPQSEIAQIRRSTFTPLQLTYPRIQRRLMRVRQEA